MVERKRIVAVLAYCDQIATPTHLSSVDLLNISCYVLNSIRLLAQIQHQPLLVKVRDLLEHMALH